ncbi:HlyD family type I secretion periplasmic adaptor subunit [Photobacterium leiognathi subsp. mandapamensis]|uniref:HlyD family type I secretion periplasmic adaptor subunit n=1 Tax=Photobacterium leiognathi TaxID=553611 RepID=UPI003BF5F156
MSKSFSEQDQDMMDDVYSAMMIDSPAKHRYMVWALFLMVVCFIVWACFAQLEQVTRGSGKVIPSSQVQVIQSYDGGMLQALYVEEGMTVTKGQPLVRIDDTRFRSDLAQQEDEEDSLNANIIRFRHELKSIEIGDETKDWKKQVRIDITPLIFTAELEQKEPELIVRQKAEYQGRLEELDNQLAILARQIVQKQQESHSLVSRISTLKSSLRLINKEMVMTKPLAKKGIVSEVDLLQLERKVNETKGELSALYAEQPKVKAALDEAILKRREAVLNYNKDVRAQLNEMTARLSRLTEAQVGSQDKVDKAVLHSPVNGTIKTINITTIGGVVKPGEAILDIVPTEDNLLIEAKVQPKDIAFLHPGLPAIVKVTAYDFTRYGGLDGTVVNISADTSQDEEGNSYYLVKVRTSHSYLTKSDQTQMPIIPGMLTSVDVITGKQTVLEYILNPILRAKEMALRER